MFEVFMGAICLVIVMAGVTCGIFALKDYYDRKKVDYIAKKAEGSYARIIDCFIDAAPEIMKSMMESTKKMMDEIDI